MRHLVRGTRVSEAAFLALPESQEHVELVDGEVILTPSPPAVHQVLLERLHAELVAWAEGQSPAFVGLSPLDVRLGPGRIVQPDLFVLRSGVPEYASPPHRVPDFVAEILSTNRSYDRLAKRVLYAEAGVEEYWMVDPDNVAIEVVAGMTSIQLARNRLASTALHGFSVDVMALFADLPWPE